MKESQKRQLKMLNRIYETCMPPRPVFKPHHDAVPDGMVPYISCSDLFDYKFNVRIIPLAEFIFGENDKLENATIVASYNSMQELVEDGWELD
jgi:hypothetical protein